MVKKHPRKPVIALAGLAALAATAVPLPAQWSTEPYAPSQAKLSAFTKGGDTTLPFHPKIADDLYSIVDALRSADDPKERATLYAKLAGPAKPAAMLKAAGAGEAVQTYIWVWDKSDETIAALESLGVEIEIVSDYRNLIQGWVPVSAIEDVAELDLVREVERPIYGTPTAGEILTEGDVLMGTALIRPRNVRGEGTGRVNGEGVTIAAFSNGLFVQEHALFTQNQIGNTRGPLPLITGFDPFPALPCNALTQEAADTNGLFPSESMTDVPAQSCLDGTTPSSGFLGDVELQPPSLEQHYVNATWPLYVDDPATFFDFDDLLDANYQIRQRPYPEGSAMLEVLHDVAPGATLVYGTARTTADLIRFRDLYGPSRPASRRADVMVDNLVFIGDGRYDGSSTVSRHAANLSREFNIPYFVSAGGYTVPNDTVPTSAGRYPLVITDFFRGDPRANRARVHSWNENVAIQRDEGLNIGNDRAIEITLVWDDFWDDDQPRAATDIDMYLVPRSSLDLSQAVAASVRLQNGNGTNPRERLTFFPSNFDRDLALVLVRPATDNNARTLFTLTVEQGTVDESRYLTHGIPFNNADALEPVISVGHIDINETLSAPAKDNSRGLVPALDDRNRFLTWYEGQNTPKIVSYGSVRTKTTDIVLSRTSGLSLDTRQRNFYGPSAAVTHMAGFAGLLRHRFPELQPQRFGELLTDVSGVDEEGQTISPLAFDLTPEETREFLNAPRYIRPNPLAVYNALDTGAIDAYGVPVRQIDLPQPVDTPVQVASASEDAVPDAAFDLAEEGDGGTAGWSNGSADPVLGYDAADTRVTAMGLEITGTSDWSYGAWRSPLLEIQGPEDAEPRTNLYEDRLYLLEARVGSDETNADRVPQFRLSIESEASDETWSLTVGGEDADVRAVPTTLGGRTYQVFFSPGSEESAAGGFRFAFEMLANDPEANSGATLVLRDVTLRELPMPEETAAPE